MPDLTSRLTDRLEPVLSRVRATTSDPVKSPRTTVIIGRLLGIAFTVCFLTGIYSHILQEYPHWLPFPRPISLYRVTQGLHVITGIASIPLLLAKLWTVFPRLFETPPVKSVLHALERAAIAVLIGASLVEVAIGLMNTFQLYALFPFPFRQTHFALAWVIMGALAIHIAVKLPMIVRYWSARSAALADGDTLDGEPLPTEGESRRGRVLSRRAFMTTVGIAVGAVTVTTAGQTVDALGFANIFGPRRQGVGPNEMPVNRTAEQAGVTETAVAPDWALEVVGDSSTTRFTLDDLRAMPQTTADLPIACVEGWSQMGQWRGVRMSDLLTAAGIPVASSLIVRSLQERGGSRISEMPAAYTADPLTLVALELNGDTLDIDHGYPARIIAPGRPGALQTKWLARIEVV